MANRCQDFPHFFSLMPNRTIEYVVVLNSHNDSLREAKRNESMTALSRIDRRSRRINII